MNILWDSWANPWTLHRKKYPRLLNRLKEKMILSLCRILMLSTYQLVQKSLLLSKRVIAEMIYEVFVRQRIGMKKASAFLCIHSYLYLLIPEKLGFEWKCDEIDGLEKMWIIACWCNDLLALEALLTANWEQILQTGTPLFLIPCIQFHVCGSCLHIGDIIMPFSNPLSSQRLCYPLLPLLLKVSLVKLAAAWGRMVYIYNQWWIGMSGFMLQEIFFHWNVLPPYIFVL